MSNRLDALTVREVGDRSYWTKIGVAFQGRDGASYIVKLDAIPAPNEGQFVIHLREPRESSGAPAGRQQPRGGDDDSDQVPF